MELYNLIQRPGKHLSEFSRSCSSEGWLEVQLYDSESNHRNSFSVILESTIRYIDNALSGVM